MEVYWLLGVMIADILQKLIKLILKNTLKQKLPVLKKSILYHKKSSRPRHKKGLDNKTSLIAACD